VTVLLSDALTWAITSCMASWRSNSGTLYVSCVDYVSFKLQLIQQEPPEAPVPLTAMPACLLSASSCKQ
jgi:hypothetical protein